MKIKEIKKPIVFIALKRICKYIINNVWNSHLLGDDITEAEFKLLIAKSKRYKKEIELLSKVDSDLDWGDKKYVEKDGRSYIKHEGDFNPWFSGDVELKDLLDSIKPLVDFIDTGDNYTSDAEFIHYFNFLKEFSGDYLFRQTPEIDIQLIKSIMTDVATGQARIQDKNSEYQNLYQKINQYYQTTKTKHLNQFPDLWEFYAYWKRKLNTYADRRAYISKIYRKLPEFKKIQSILKSQRHQYINIERIQELRSIRHKDFDLTKLLRFCEEINIVFETDCYLAIAMLIRSILNHVPPVFGVTTFSEVTGKGSKSFKESMTRLDKSLRKIADSYLHTLIRSKETLPNSTQVDFSNDLDVLLAEVYRFLK